MKRLNKTPLVWFTLFLGLLCLVPKLSFAEFHALTPNSQTRKVRFQWIPPKDQWRGWGFYEYLKTEENYDNNGNVAKINSLGASLVQHKVQVGYEQSIFDDASLRGELDWRSLSGESTFSTGTLSNSASGLGDFLVGVRYRLSQTPVWEFGLDGNLLFPFYDASKINRNSELALGDGSTNYALSALARWILGDWALAGSFGYRGRSGGFSTDLPYLLELRKENGSFLFGAGLSGRLSLETDTYTGSNGGGASAWLPSYINNAINPTHHQGNGWVGFELSEKLLAKAFVGIPIAGNNTWSGISGGVGLTYTPVSDTVIEDDTEQEDFKEYSLEATIIQVSSKMNFLKIDRGTDDGVAIGNYFEIHGEGTDEFSNDIVASAQVVRIRSDTAILRVMRYYKEVLIEQGMRAKRVLTRPR